MASKSKAATVKREKHATYYVSFANDHARLVYGPAVSKAEAMRGIESAIATSDERLVGPFALLKVRTDVVATFDLVTETVTKLAKL